MAQEVIERKFDVNGPASLMLANISGSVDIQAGDEGVITIRAVNQGNGDTEHTRIEMTQDDRGAVTVKTEYSESFWHLFGQRPCDVVYTVRAPRNTALTLKVVSSAATVNGLAGQFDVSTVSGELSIADLTGPLRINAVSGAVKAEKLSGAADISTVSGKVTLAGCNFPSLKLSTVSGGLMLETPLGEGPYEVHSVSGDVLLSVPANSGCNVDFTTLSGRVSSNLPTTHSQQSGRSRHLQLQGGGVTVKFDSISANLNIQGAGGSAAENREKTVMPLIEPVAPVAPPKPVEIPEAAIEAAAKARQDILDRVAQGKLSVDDAVNLLRG